MLNEKDVQKLTPFLMKGKVVNLEVKDRGRKGREILLEYEDGTKMVGDLNQPVLRMRELKGLQSIVSYFARGKYGSNAWRGNCSGLLIKDLLDYYKPDTFGDLAVGSGTSIEVAKDLGYSASNAVFSDLNPKYGGIDISNPDLDFPLLDFIFFHPPYYVFPGSSMPVYSGKGADGIKPETLSKVNATPNIYDVRFFDGRFFRRVKNREFVCGGKGYATAKDLQDHIESMMYGYHCGRNFEEQAKEAQSCADAFLFVEKEVWRECGEPRYEVCTFGLGHNHGGTSAFVQFGYNGNIPYCNYFNANQKTEAIAYADKIASERGDTKSVGRCFDFADIDILMPDVFTCDPKKEHGNGDPFMNSLEEMIRSTDSANEAAILTMATCAKKL